MKFRWSRSASLQQHTYVLFTRCRPSFSIGSTSSCATSANAPTLPSVASSLSSPATSCRHNPSPPPHAPLQFPSPPPPLPLQLPGVASNELSLSCPSPDLKISAQLAAHAAVASSNRDENWAARIPVGLKEFCAPAFASQLWRDADFACVELTTMCASRLPQIWPRA